MGGGSRCLYLSTLIYSEYVKSHMNRLTCLDSVSEGFLFLETVNRATLYTFVFD